MLKQITSNSIYLNHSAIKSENNLLFLQPIFREVLITPILATSMLMGVATLESNFYINQHMLKKK